MFIQKFTSGCRISNGKYNLFTTWHRGVLTVEITEKQVLITTFGATLWEAARSKISTVKIESEILGAKVKIITHDGKDFLFFIDDITRLVNTLKILNFPIQYDENAFRAGAKRYAFASNSVVLIIANILGIVFIIFFIYAVMIGSR